MNLQKVAGGCEGGDCPTVYLTDRGTAVFQGNLVPPGVVSLGEGEQAVELPIEVVRDALLTLHGGAA